MTDIPDFEYWKNYVRSLDTGGGDGLTVDNRVDPPFAATGLIAPGAVQSGDDADLSGVLTFRKVGPYSIAFNTPSIATDGILVGDPIPAGSLIEAKAIVTATWDGASNLTIVVGSGTPGVDFSGVPTEPTSCYRRLDLAQVPGGSTAVAEAPVRDATPGGGFAHPVAVLTTAESRLFLNIIFDTPSTTGTAEIYAIIATPAA